MCVWQGGDGWCRMAEVRGSEGRGPRAVGRDARLACGEESIQAGQCRDLRASTRGAVLDRSDGSGQASATSVQVQEVFALRGRCVVVQLTFLGTPSVGSSHQSSRSIGCRCAEPLSESDITTSSWRARDCFLLESPQVAQ